jgi:hypothetical protein
MCPTRVLIEVLTEAHRTLVVQLVQKLTAAVEAFTAITNALVGERGTNKPATEVENELTKVVAGLIMAKECFDKAALPPLMKTTKRSAIYL